MAFLSDSQLAKMGFAAVGQNCLISDKASFYNPSNITIGHHVRIDDFCVLSAGDKGIELGNYIHIAVFCSLIGQELISMADYSGTSSRVAVYSSTDDFSGRHLTNPMVDDKFRGVISEPVVFKKHALVGAGSVVLPGSTLNEGVAVGALSLVKGELSAYSIFAGVPARYIKDRDTNLVKLEQQHAEQAHHSK
jgi:dTDP-4-amino-4,6-dideoxy-D-glucose acyltransferase